VTVSEARAISLRDLVMSSRVEMSLIVRLNFKIQREIPRLRPE
jgi:hypothetical protein